MPPLPRGLYEQLLTEALAVRLGEMDARGTKTAELRAAEAADRIALHVSRIVERAIAAHPDKERRAAGLDLARRVLAQIDQEIARGEEPIEPGNVLSAVCSILPDGSPEELEAPLIPLLDTTLLTNAPGEPRVGGPASDRDRVRRPDRRRDGVHPPKWHRALARIAPHAL